MGEVAFYLRTSRTASIVASSSVYVLSPASLQRVYEEEREVAAALHKNLAQLLAQRLSERVALLRTVLA